MAITAYRCGRIIPSMGRTLPDDSPFSTGRLSRIDTLWSVVRQAHDPQHGGASQAQEQLLNRYGGAIRRYLLGALRDREAAEELFQEFALKFVQGDFKEVSPEKGRFRSFVKTVLFRMIALHYRRKGTRKEHNVNLDLEQHADTENSSSVLDQQFLDSWRDELLVKTWQALADYEATGGGPYHTVLQLRVKNPGLNTESLAAEIGKELGKSTSPGSGRVLVHRAREKFAYLLIEMIAESLANATDEAIEAELIDLQLIDYCRAALADHRAAKSDGKQKS